MHKISREFKIIEKKKSIENSVYNSGCGPSERQMESTASGYIYTQSQSAYTRRRTDRNSSSPSNEETTCFSIYIFLSRNGVFVYRRTRRGGKKHISTTTTTTTEIHVYELHVTPQQLALYMVSAVAEAAVAATPRYFLDKFSVIHVFEIP